MFKIDASRIWELVQIEEEVNCDIGAGSDIGNPKVNATSYVDSNKFIAAKVQRARSLRNARRTLGVSGICEHIEDVDGDWLENWTDTQNTPANDEADKGALTL